MNVIDEIKKHLAQWEKENPDHYGKICYEINYKAGKPVVVNIDTRQSIKLD